MSSFELRLMIGRHALVFMERGPALENVRSIVVEADGENVGVIRLLEIYPPGIVIATSYLLVWGGLDVYTVHLETFRMHNLEVSDVVMSVYDAYGAWLLICETSVRALGRNLGELSRYEHNEVILNHTWSGDTIRLMDYYGQEVVLRCSENGIHRSGATQ